MECCSRRTCRWDINHVQNQHGLALLANFSLKCQTEWLISKVYSYFPCGLTFLALSSWASTFGILENYHCWRFHGSGVIAVLQIIWLIFFCTGMHQFRAGVLVFSTRTRSTRVLNFWYSYCTREFQSHSTRTCTHNRGARTSTGTSTDILWYICDVRVKNIIPLK